MKDNKAKSEKGKVNKNVITLYVVLGVCALIVLTAIVAGINLYSKTYVASVGGTKISVAEFKFFLHQEKQNMLKIAENPDPETFWDTTITGGEKAIDIAKKKALENAWEFKVELLKAKEQKITLDKSDLDYVNAVLNAFVLSYNNDKSLANAACEQLYGIKLDEFKEIYKEILLRNKLLNKEMDSTTASEDEIEEYYNKMPDAFTDTAYRNNGEEAVWVKHILVSTEDKETGEELTGDKLEEAKKKAEELLQRAKSGENFASLAKEYSDDEGSAMYGGDYVFGKGYMVLEFEDMAFSLEPGQIDMVQTAYGYHIIKLEEKIAKGEPVSLRCAKEYWEFGTNGVKVAKYMEKMEEWKKDPKYKVVKNEKVYNSIE